MSAPYGFTPGFIFGFFARRSSNLIREPLQGANVIDGIVQQNGFNTYQISFEPKVGTLRIFADGLLLRESPSKDFVRNGTNIVFTEPPEIGVSLEAEYMKR